MVYRDYFSLITTLSCTFIYEKKAPYNLTTNTQTYIFYIYILVYVCVCVCIQNKQTSNPPIYSLLKCSQVFPGVHSHLPQKAK